jgi:hypothetical protein
MFEYLFLFETVSQCHPDYYESDGFRNGCD